MVETGKRGLKVVTVKEQAKAKDDDDTPQLWSCIRDGARPLDEFRFSQFETLEFPELVATDPQQTIKLT